MFNPEELIEPVDIDISREGFTLILFNDSYHDFDEVIEQVIKATGYNYDKAEEITLEAHNKGKAAVLTGELDICLKAQSVLEEINLRTSLEVSV
ncbi:MAG: ATP-dependent Clp protease adaptor ClpS [Ignavibacteriae bacterium]|nr:MAG: ATP-dependent Clp protease adaptor ClpS [Ignavibacteriota bacterium]